MWSEFKEKELNQCYVFIELKVLTAKNCQSADQNTTPLTVGTSAPLHRSLSQQLKSHFLIVVDSSCLYTLQLSSLHADFIANPFLKIREGTPSLSASVSNFLHQNTGRVQLERLCRSRKQGLPSF